jgi:hypothetical protein
MDHRPNARSCVLAVRGRRLGCTKCRRERGRRAGGRSGSCRNLGGPQEDIRVMPGVEPGAANPRTLRSEGSHARNGSGGRMVSRGVPVPRSDVCRRHCHA